MSPRFSLFALVNRTWFCVFLVALVTWILYRPLLFQAAHPGTDQSVFLYGGWRVSLGEMPYVAFWDHKGPLIYLINAFPFVFGPTVDGSASLRSIVWLEMACMTAALSSLFLLLRAHLGWWGAFVGLASLVAAFRWPIGDGNYIEEWAFCLNCAVLALAFAPRFMRILISAVDPSLSNALRGVAIGFFVALTLLLRPNEAGVGFAVVLFWLVVFRFQKRLLPLWIGFICGFALPLVIAALWLQRGGAWADFIDQYWVFNQLYSNATFSDRLTSVVKGAVRFGTRGTFIVALCGLLLLLKQCRKPVESGLSSETWLFLCFAALLLPLQITLSCLSGRAYPHYYIAWWLPCAILCAYVGHNIRWRRPAPDSLQGQNQTTPWKRWLIAILLVFALAELGKSGFGSLRHRRDASPEEVAFIAARSKPDQSVLVWGEEVALHLHTRRRGASRFVYHSPVTGYGAVRAGYYNQFLQEISKSRPAVVIDATTEAATGKRTDSSDSSEMPSMSTLPELQRWLASDYRLVKQSQKGWLLYERTN